MSYAGVESEDEYARRTYGLVSRSAVDKAIRRAEIAERKVAAVEALADEWRRDGRAIPANEAADYISAAIGAER